MTPRGPLRTGMRNVNWCVSLFGRIYCRKQCWARKARPVFVMASESTLILSRLFLKTNGNDGSESCNLFDFGSLTLVLLMAANDFIVRVDECSKLGEGALGTQLKINFKQVAAIQHPFCL